MTHKEWMALDAEKTALAKFQNEYDMRRTVEANQAEGYRKVMEAYASYRGHKSPEDSWARLAALLEVLEECCFLHGNGQVQPLGTIEAPR